MQDFEAEGREEAEEDEEEGGMGAVEEAEQCR